MKKEVIAEYTYELQELTDEEIRSFFEAEGVVNVNPEEVRSYIRERLYELYCEAAIENKQG